MKVVVGIDVSKAKLDVALLIGEKVRSKTLPNTAAGFEQLVAWLQRQAPAGVAGLPVCMEASGVYHEAVATYLHEQGLQVSVVNPLQIKRYGQSKLMRGKSDAADARLIAQYCASESPEAWKPLPASVRLLRELVQRLGTLQTMQRMELNRLDIAHQAVRSSIQEVLQALDKQIAEVLQQIKRTIDDDPDLRQRSDLLDSIPGLGEKTIAQLLACIAEPSRFKSVKALVAYVGLSPAPQQSGTSLNVKRGTNKQGHGQLRAALYFPAMVAGRYNPVIKRLWERLSAQGKPGKLVVVACMHKLLALAFGVLRSGKPFDPALHGT